MFKLYHIYIYIHTYTSCVYTMYIYIYTHDLFNINEDSHDGTTINAHISCLKYEISARQGKAHGWQRKGRGNRRCSQQLDFRQPTVWHFFGENHGPLCPIVFPHVQTKPWWGNSLKNKGKLMSGGMVEVPSECPHLWWSSGFNHPPQHGLNMFYIAATLTLLRAWI